MPYPSLTAERTGVKVVRFILGAVLAGIILGQIGLSVLMMLAYRPASSNAITFEQIVTINQGMSGKEIGKMLKESGLILNSHLFNLMLHMTKTGSKLQAGEYLLNPAMSIFEVIEKLKDGIVVTYPVIIPEGYNLKQIADLLAEKNLVDENRFLMLAHNAELVYGDDLPLELPIKSLEGYLFPDTYQFAKGQSEEAIIGHMVARFIDHVLPQIDFDSFGGKYSLHEVVTLASIVEKEVIMDWERPIVAAVYLNRLDINMRLQADPTVRYVMTENRSRVLYSDLEIDSPYNTYRYDGLPPGPIASPGIKSILAVLNPADVDYLYFVSKRNGTHQFSRTFSEHVAARRKLGY